MTFDEGGHQRQGGGGWELFCYLCLLISMGLAAFLYSGALDHQLDNALIPQRITTPCTMLFVLLALIFLAMAVAERSPPPEIYEARKKARLEAIQREMEQEGLVHERDRKQDSR